ncbi:hypothetical protein D1007_34660 [Hordeum vulgare]|nr:hypothetical protein D1007_34660 [Hordeum vulgare]
MHPDPDPDPDLLPSPASLQSALRRRRQISSALAPPAAAPKISICCHEVRSPSSRQLTTTSGVGKACYFLRLDLMTDIDKRFPPVGSGIDKRAVSSGLIWHRSGIASTL